MKFYNIHTHSYSNYENLFEIVNQFPQHFNVNIPNYSIGIHPWHINEKSLQNELQIIEEQLKNQNCIALGECGLDKRIEIPLKIQRSVMEQQLLLADKYNKPAIVHCVSAFQEMIEIKKKLKINVPMIIHGFSKNIQVAHQLLDNGFYLSFGKYLMMNPALESVFKFIPNDRFFLETDSSNFTIQQVYATAASCKKITIDDLKNICNANFATIFKS